MKNFLSVLFIFFFFPSLSFAASYPASCPVEARSIVDAVGGCSVIDPVQHSSIYGKCCSMAATDPESSSEWTLEEPPEYIPEVLPEAPDTSLASFYALMPIVIWGGLIYFIVWFVRKLKKKKD